MKQLEKEKQRLAKEKLEDKSTLVEIITCAKMVSKVDKR